jgi:2-polyprenyl-6-methoxyphenol hydroxylase-like FAD-dependent oxidoreductase
VPKGIVYLIRPDNYGTTRVSVNFTAEENQYRHLNLNQQKEALIQKIRGSGFESERMIAAIETADDLYFDRVSQVKAPHWNKGRIVMTGDAAFCATPISGKGIDLAMTGAYILAGEMMLAADHAHAFETYEKKMRPYVERCQQLPPGIPKMVYPKTKTGIRILNTLISFAGSRFVKNVLKLFGGEEKKKQNEIDLPDYVNLFRKRA